MGAGPLTAGAPDATPQIASPPRWKLSDALAPLTQGIVASGFASLPYGRALLLAFRWTPDVLRGGDGAWLDALFAVAPITSAARAARQTRAAALAFTCTGLTAMGLGGQALASFSRPFHEAMFQEDRARRLGDRRDSNWLETVVDNGPGWSANAPLRDPTKRSPDWIDAYDVRHDDPSEESVQTPLTVHALLLLYTKSDADAVAWSDQVRTALAVVRVESVRELDLLLDVQKQDSFSREHFGFADGLSQPVPYGATMPVDESDCVRLNGEDAPKNPVQGVPLGEILLGYQNGHSEPAPGPVVARETSAKPTVAETRAAAAAAACLPIAPQAEGFADLGIHGSYLVVRELKQDVAAFWTSLDANAARIHEDDPSATQVDPLWLAERVIGRSIDGHLLCPGSYLKPDCYNQPDNEYLFSERDPHGAGCPPGSHVRRAFPRDALAPKPTADSRRELLQAANNHRILRRGRKYGGAIANNRVDDGVERGLLFMALNTDIERQFEFVQQTWLLNTTFNTLYEETDPLLGPAGQQTLRGETMRRRVNVESYVKMAGGDYFFLPGVAALDYLRRL